MASKKQVLDLLEKKKQKKYQEIYAQKDVHREQYESMRTKAEMLVEKNLNGMSMKVDGVDVLLKYNDSRYNRDIEVVVTDKKYDVLKKKSEQFCKKRDEQYAKIEEQCEKIRDTIVLEGLNEEVVKQIKKVFG